VPHQGDVLRGTRRALRVKVLQRALQGLANGLVVQRQRGVGGVVDLPDLVVAAQVLVAQHLVGHVDPGLGAAGQSVQHDDGASVRVVGLHQVDAGAHDAVAQPHQGAQRLGGKAGARQPQPVARGEVARQRHPGAGQLDLADTVGVEGLQLHLARGQDLFQALSGKVQHHGDGGKQRLLVGRAWRAFQHALGGACQIAVRIALEHGHQLGTEAIAAVLVAQPGKA